ncbi:MAG: PAS domain-containing protein [Desulfobulbaceae bacterium]|uniref:histidine kinase n=1 Tax=Candidatus Desulfatifera sulfidica TaxID=2841691 RepID=A0A8J6NAA6_9BACT|nr:PAS domain-containing protein [Candidatus Desulfatifera sulfidica]
MSANHNSPLPLLRILLIEDSEDDACAFDRALAKSTLEAEITHHYKAEDILPSLDEIVLSYDVLVADYKLPGITGLELCREVIARDIPVPCVILTGAGSEGIAVEALQSGVNDYLTKDYQQAYLDILPVFLPQVIKRFKDKTQAAIARKEKEVIASVFETCLSLGGDENAFCKKLSESLTDGFPFPTSTIALLNKEKTEFSVLGKTGFNDPARVPAQIPTADIACWNFLLQGNVTDGSKASCDQNNESCPFMVLNSKTCLAIPVKTAKDNCIGIVIAGDSKVHHDSIVHTPSLQVIATHLGQMVERSRMEHELQASKALLVEAESIAHIGSWSYDLKTDQLLWSDEIFRIFGFDQQRFGASYEAFLAAVHPEDRESLDNVYTHSVENGSPYDLVHRIIRQSDGEVRNIHERCRHIRDDNGQVVRSIGTVHDITVQKKVEEQLVQSQKMEAVSTLAGGIAHDFNNALSGIIGMSQLIKKEIPEDSRLRENLNTVITSGLHAADLVEKILIFSRKSERHPQTIAPHVIILETLDILQASLPATVSLRQEIDPACGNILADPQDVQQILVNLYNNACHAMEDREGTLTVNLVRKDLSEKETTGRSVPPGPFVVLSVSDTGRGMDDSTQKEIFIPYFTTRKRDHHKGVGLGLAVVRGVVDDLNGFIQVESSPPKGSTFRVYIPALD